MITFPFGRKCIRCQEISGEMRVNCVENLKNKAEGHFGTINSC